MILALLLACSAAVAHSPTVDADLSDWCLGATSNGVGGARVEDSSAELTCGNCSTSTNQACSLDTDCPGAETCVNLTSKVETVWWDNRTDGAVNDLGTVAVTQDNEFLYISAELWVDPDPVSLPFGQFVIDYTEGGLNEFDDPLNNLVAPGNCSVSTDRNCTSDADCHFCAISTEPFPSTRVRACGSGCNPDIPADVCDQSQTCVNLGAGGLKRRMGANAGPAFDADYLLLFDFSFWLVSAGDSVLLKEPGTLDPSTPWDTVFGCTPDFLGDDTACDFEPAVNPGASGGSGGPPGGIEVAIPWSAFGCTGCPGACSCPGFGPGQDFRFSLMVARGTTSLDFRVDGAIEDVLSESAGGTTTTSTQDCPGMGTMTTACELADGSHDAMVPRDAVLANEVATGGRLRGLTVDKSGGDVILEWGASCSDGDDDYGVYEGTLASLSGGVYDHLVVAGLCSTGGTTSATFAPGASSHYYLVVPNSAASEGSYGLDSGGAQRPASTSPCEPQSVGNCP
ncbi:hypothetical protein ABI59_04400 [Acidobacteria bacterium Mor1]|nr:hypothetical protein ABI59_04400 [Acidobacteria bacterium Mor1]